MNKCGKPMALLVADVLKRIREEPETPPSSAVPEAPIAQPVEPIGPTIEVECYKEVSTEVCANAGSSEVAEKQALRSQNLSGMQRKSSKDAGRRARSLPYREIP